MDLIDFIFKLNYTPYPSHLNLIDRMKKGIYFSFDKVGGIERLNQEPRRKQRGMFRKAPAEFDDLCA